MVWTRLELKIPVWKGFETYAFSDHLLFSITKVQTEHSAFTTYLVYFFIAINATEVCKISMLIIFFKTQITQICKTLLQAAARYAQTIFFVKLSLFIYSYVLLTKM